MLIEMVKTKLRALRLARDDAQSLMSASGSAAYAEARRRERASLVRPQHDPLRNGAHWRRVAGIIARA